MSEPMILTNTYDIQLAEKPVSLRLTVAAQLRLKNKHKMDIMDVIMNGATDTELLISVFDEALHFSGNQNDDMTGEELYDALVDNGIKGMDAFAEILFKIANTSGILSDEQKEKVNSGISKSINFIFDRIKNGMDKELAALEPTENTNDIGEEVGNTVSFPKHN